MTITSTSNVCFILQIACVILLRRSKFSSLRIYTLGVLSAKVQLLKHFLLILTLLLYDLASTKVGLELPGADRGLLERRRWRDTVGWLVEVGRWLSLRRQRAMVMP